MKKFVSILTLSAASSSLFAAAGIFDSFAIVEGTYYDLGADTANADFIGSNFGSFDPSDSLQLGGQLKSFKNNGTDVQSASLFYVIYEEGNRPGSPTFSEITYSFQIDNVGGTPGDQQWGTDVAGSNATDDSVTISLGSLSANTTYALEVFSRITTNGTDADTEIFSNNSGNNFVGSFTVVPEPGTYALLSGLMALSFIMVRRRKA